MRKIKNFILSIGNERLRNSLLQAIPFWVASTITGLLVVAYTWLFNFAESGANSVAHHHPVYIFLLTPICFISAYLLVKKFAPFSKGSGIPQVMAAVELANPKTNEKIKHLLSIKIIVVKIASSMLMILGGGLIGKEGPAVQIAGSVFKKINDWLPSWWPKISRKNMIMTGAAAGLAAAFNTPLGGIVFAVEELTKTHINYFKTALFSGVIIAGLTAQGILGPYLYLGYPVINKLTGFVAIGVILIGLITGLTGAYMSKLVYVILKWKAKWKSPLAYLIYAGTTGLLVALIIFFYGHDAYGSGKELMNHVLFSQDKHLSLAVPSLRIVGTILSFTTGAAGGIFAPALSAGASMGSMLSGFMNLSDSDTNLVILTGMVGFLTGVTRSPFTSAIIVLEMTDRQNLIFYLMLAGMVSSLVTIIVEKKSLYDQLKKDYIKELDEESSPAHEAEPALHQKTDG